MSELACQAVSDQVRVRSQPIAGRTQPHLRGEEESAVRWGRGSGMGLSSIAFSDNDQGHFLQPHHPDTCPF